MSKIVSLLALGVLFTVNGLKAQEAVPVLPIEVEMSDQYRVDGYIFPLNADLPKPLNTMSRYTPTIDEVRTAEKIFRSEYNKVTGDATDPGVYYAKFVRQYVGYIAPNGEKKVLIQLVNNKKPRKTNQVLGKGWSDHFVRVTSNDIVAIMAFFVANLDSGKLSTDL